MAKRATIMLAVVFVALVSVIVWQVARQREPAYKGRTLSFWLKTYGRSCMELHVPPAGREEATEAVRQAGTNAIPTLLRSLEGIDSKQKAAAAYSPLKVKWMALLRKLHFIEAHDFSAAAMYNGALLGFEVLGTNAQCALPALIQLASNTNELHSRDAAVVALGSIGPPARLAIPTLLRWVTNTDLPVRDQITRQFAISSLGEIGPSAKAVVPALLECLGDRNLGVRMQATNALPLIDPEAAAKVGITNVFRISWQFVR